MIFSVESSDSLIGCKAISARSLSLLSVIVHLVWWSLLFRRLKLFSPCINSEFRQILNICHCKVLLSKRSFLLILYLQAGHCTPRTPRGQEDYCPPTVPGLRKGNAGSCNIKRASPWVLSASQGGTRIGGWGARGAAPLARHWTYK